MTTGLTLQVGWRRFEREVMLGRSMHGHTRVQLFWVLFHLSNWPVGEVSAGFSLTTVVSCVKLLLGEASVSTRPSRLPPRGQRSGQAWGSLVRGFLAISMRVFILLLSETCLDWLSPQRSGHIRLHADSSPLAHPEAFPIYRTH